MKMQVKTWINTGFGSNVLIRHEASAFGMFYEFIFNLYVKKTAFQLCFSDYLG
jgi:hypothetical protein